MSKNKHNREAAQGASQATPEVSTVETSQNKPESMAAFLDRMIAEGGELEDIAAAAKAEAESRGLRTKFNRGTIQAHIKFRENQAKKKAEKAAKKEAEAEVEG